MVTTLDFALKSLDPYMFLGNCPPTPPLKPTLTLTSHLGQNVDSGEGRGGETYNDLNVLCAHYMS